MNSIHQTFLLLIQLSRILNRLHSWLFNKTDVRKNIVWFFSTIRVMLLGYMNSLSVFGVSVVFLSLSIKINNFLWLLIALKKGLRFSKTLSHNNAFSYILNVDFFGLVTIKIMCISLECQFNEIIWQNSSF